MLKASGRQRGLQDYAHMQNGGGVATANARLLETLHLSFLLSLSLSLAVSRTLQEDLAWGHMARTLHYRGTSLIRNSPPS